MAGPGYVATCLSLSEILPKTQWSEWMSDFLCWLDLLLMLSELISFCAIMFWWNPPRYFIHVCHQHSSFEMLLPFLELHICLLSYWKKRLSREVSPWAPLEDEWAGMHLYLLSRRYSLRFSAVVPKIFLLHFDSLSRFIVGGAMSPRSVIGFDPKYIISWRFVVYCK